MTVAVTGGTGFIGRILVRNLHRRGVPVRILTRKTDTTLPDGSVAIQGDLTDPKAPLEALLDGVETLYHCAGEIKDPAQMRSLHLDGTERLIRAACAVDLGFWVQLSSVGAYGPRQVGRVTEDTPDAPYGIYEVTKTDADRLICSAAESGAFQARILRPANVIGPQMPNESFRRLIAAVKRGHFFFIGKPGALTNYVASDNVAVALEAISHVDGREVEVFNLAETLPLEDIIAAICEGLARPMPRHRVPYWAARMISLPAGLLPGFPLTASRIAALTSRVSYSSDKLNRQTSYKPVVALPELVRTMAKDLSTNELWGSNNGSS